MPPPVTTIKYSDSKLRHLETWTEKRFTNRVEQFKTL